MSGKKNALKKLTERREQSQIDGKIDDSRLYAGAPMHFYCKYCGVATEVLPELYTGIPKTVCDACQTLVKKGWHDNKMPSFPYHWR